MNQFRNEEGVAAVVVVMFELKIQLNNERTLFSSFYYVTTNKQE